jgi:hypothetical protein
LIYAFGPDGIESPRFGASVQPPANGVTRYYAICLIENEAVVHGTGFAAWPCRDALGRIVEMHPSAQAQGVAALQSDERGVISTGARPLLPVARFALHHASTAASPATVTAPIVHILR